MKKKLGPLPVWAWALIGGGTIGAVLLWKKSKAAAGETTPSPELAGQAEIGGGSAGGGSALPEGGEAKSSAEAQLLREELQFVENNPVNSSTQGASFTEQLEQLQAENTLLREVTGGVNAQTKEGTGNSAVKAATGAAKNTQAGNPRSGLTYKTTTYLGKAAHEYATKVTGGVGPGGRFVILPGAAVPTHAVGPTHASAPAAKAQVNASAGNPRAGMAYTRTTYKGKAAHEYAKAVSGGVGPGKRYVIV